MAKLKYVGAYPDTDNAMGRTDYTNARFAQQAVTTADVTAAINNAKGPLALKTYVDQQDALYVAKTYVDQQDALLINANQLGATNGVGPLGANAKISVPPPLGNVAGAFTVHTTYATVRDGINTAGVLCKSVTIPNPGFPWLPLWTGWTMGRYSAAPYSFPGVSIRHSSGVWVARGYGTARNIGESYPITIVPTFDVSITPLDYYTGQQTFSIYYTREYGTGTVSVGEASSWFTCLVIPVATTSTITVIS